MNLKKLLSAATIGTLMFGLVACGGNKPAEEEAPAENNTAVEEPANTEAPAEEATEEAPAEEATEEAPAEEEVTEEKAQ